MATRTNGTVQSVSSNGAAVVHYDDPPPNGEDVTYTDLSDAERQTMLAGLNAGIKVDVTTTTGTTDVTGVVAHR